MAKHQVFTDGFVQEVEDGDPMIRLENLNVEAQPSQEAYDAALKIYEQARRVKSLHNNAGFVELVRDLEAQVKDAGQMLLSYSGTDSVRKEELWQNHRDKKVVLDYLLNTIEEAASVPRPIL